MEITSGKGRNTSIQALRRRLLGWYRAHARDLPWRRTADPFRILVSEVMLQQTRVAAAVPYYERFIARFPDVESLAIAPEEEALKLWAGLGYYSRIRNLQKAAREIAASGSFPCDYEALRKLPGAGEYTASAVASIAFGEARAAVDGNVRRVIARVINDGGADMQSIAARWLDNRNPGDFNQAMMELGATICLPREPRCGECPIESVCRARRAGTAGELPPKRARTEPQRLDRTLLVIERGGRLLLAPSHRVRGFWDLPEPFAGVTIEETVGVFRHSITHRDYCFTVCRARVRVVPMEFRWHSRKRLGEIVLSTTATKALHVFNSGRPEKIRPR